MNRTARGILIIRVHHNMAIALSTQNMDITAFTFGRDPIHLSPQNIKEELKRSPRIIYNRTVLDRFRDIVALSKTIKASKPDIVHVNALQDLISAFVAVRICTPKKYRPAIIAMSRNQLSWESPLNAWLYAKIIKYFADGFIALATTHRDRLLRSGIPPQKLTVIPNPYDPTFAGANGNCRLGRSEAANKIIYVANICRDKAQDVLIEAAACVLKKHPSCQFELVGRVITGEEEYAEKLRSMVKNFGIEESVHFTGEIPYEDVLASLQKSDIFVFPTLAEMMPRSVIEAMVIGKPVIASGVDGILDLIQHKKTGMLVLPGNIDELASAICELVENPDLARSLGSAGQKFILDFCSPEKVGKQFCDFYLQILNSLA